MYIYIYVYVWGPDSEHCMRYRFEVFDTTVKKAVFYKLGGGVPFKTGFRAPLKGAWGRHKADLGLIFRRPLWLLLYIRGLFCGVTLL